MKIKWIGHACFVITSDKGVKALTDPFAPGGDLKLTYPVTTENIDIVTVSHEHHDHNDTSWAKGQPKVLRVKDSVTVKDVSVRSIAAWHDEVGGKERGASTIFCFDVGGIKVCHLGDLGHQLSADEKKTMGKVDVLLMPVGGVYTIDTEGATQVYNDLKPRVAIPMHFKTEHCQWLKGTADDFARGKKVRKHGSNEIEFTVGSLPAESEVVVLKYAGQA